MHIKKDIFTVQLTNLNIDSGDKTNATFRLNIPNKRSTGYDNIILYLDSFNAQLFQLVTDSILIQATGFYQKNSLSSITKGASRTIGQANRPIYRDASNSIVEKLDNVETYAPLIPIPISNIPDEITITLTDYNGNAINLETNGNVYHMRLRLECEYYDHNSPCGCK